MDTSRRSAPPGILRWRDPVQEFLATESGSGIVLAAAAAIAICWATATPHGYALFWEHRVGLGLGGHVLHLTREDVAREGLMPVFFFVVGLEIKRELVVGELSDVAVARVPVIAALGGMVVPALLYVAINRGTAEVGGWGIPMATDIAFVVGVMALLGSRVPAQLKVFMLAIAVVDDIGAIVVIAVFYSGTIAVGWLAVGAGCIALAVLALWRGVRFVPLYVALGIGSCLAMAGAGVSPTIDAVAFGLMMPMAPWRPPAGADAAADGDVPTAVEVLERRVHPWSAYVVLPLFALASAGIPLSLSVIRDAATDRVAVGVAVGLVVGKPLGVFAATWLAVALGLGTLPAGLRWAHVAAGAALAGIGFTVAIFISDLAFSDPRVVDLAKIGVLTGSIVAALIGVAAAWLAGRRQAPG